MLNPLRILCGRGEREHLDVFKLCKGEPIQWRERKTRFEYHSIVLVDFGKGVVSTDDEVHLAGKLCKTTHGTAPSYNR